MVNLLSVKFPHPGFYGKGLRANLYMNHQKNGNFSNFRLKILAIQFDDIELIICNFMHKKRTDLVKYREKWKFCYTLISIMTCEKKFEPTKIVIKDSIGPNVY